MIVTFKNKKFQMQITLDKQKISKDEQECYS